MKNLLIILFFIPILSFSQNIGEKIPEELLNFMGMKQTEVCKIYTYYSEDSSIVIGVDIKDDLIFSIDYIISEEKVSNTGLEWLKSHKMVGRNIYYDHVKKDFYFIIYLENKIYIQRRNASRI